MTQYSPRQDSINRNEMDRTWRSFAWLIEDKVKSLDWTVYKMYSEAITFGVNKDYCQEFIAARLLEVINKAADEREEELKAEKARRANRSRKRAL